MQKTIFLMPQQSTNSTRIKEDNFNHTTAFIANRHQVSETTTQWEHSKAKP